ncbi:MAG: hypothetical protein KAG89_20350 [Fulvimarina manganoxydans]|uniref:hypothetical protein n=1 Tax=Fulvimarina manganoxydans TaxID=937218 RepID=UPI00235392BB|nr:hypothetical protein [Fulvimarina manganoxydans]MCK5934511.1 hypothetical protein [Fulvimarina manganoxydans]
MNFDTIATWSTIAIAAILASISFTMGMGWLAVTHESRLVWDVATEANVWTWFAVIILISGGN